MNLGPARKKSHRWATSSGLPQAVLGSAGAGREVLGRGRSPGSTAPERPLHPDVRGQLEGQAPGSACRARPWPCSTRSSSSRRSAGRPMSRRSPTSPPPPARPCGPATAWVRRTAARALLAPGALQQLEDVSAKGAPSKMAALFHQGGDGPHLLLHREGERPRPPRDPPGPPGTPSHLFPSARSAATSSRRPPRRVVVAAHVRPARPSAERDRLPHPHPAPVTSTSLPSSGRSMPPPLPGRVNVGTLLPEPRCPSPDQLRTAHLPCRARGAAPGAPRRGAGPTSHAMGLSLPRRSADPRSRSWRSAQGELEALRRGRQW